MEGLAEGSQVAADRVGEQPKVGLAPGDLDAEVAAAEGRVEHDAAGARLGHLRVRPAGLVKYPAGVRRAQVGQDVARLERLQQEPGELAAPGRRRLVPGGGIADVDHQRHAEVPGGRLGRGDDLLAGVLEGGADNAELDPRDEARVVLGRFRQGVPVDVAGRVDVRGTRHSVRVTAGVHQRDDPGLGPGQDVGGEDAEVGDADGPAVGDRGDAGAHPDVVGVAAAHAHALRDRAAGDVRVQVDEAGHDVPAGPAHLDDARGVLRLDVRGDLHDLAAGNRDVERRVEVLAGVQDVPSLDQQVVGHAARPFTCAVVACLPVRSLAPGRGAWPRRSPRGRRGSRCRSRCRPGGSPCRRRSRS